MKKSKLITKKLTKVVAFAMAAMLAVTPIMASAGEIQSRDGAFGADLEQYVDPDDYSNSAEEAKTVHDNSTKVAEYEAAAAAAETAAEEAAEAVAALETEIANAEAAISEANAAVSSVGTQTTTVSNQTTAVQNQTNSVQTTTNNVNTHNGKVDSANALITDATAAIGDSTNVAVETEEAEETEASEETGATEASEETQEVPTEDIVAYTADKAADAQQAAADAEEALRNAIAVDTTDIANEEVAGYVQDAKDAAAAAQEAADDAEDAINVAYGQLSDAIDAYNTAARALGLSTIEYDAENDVFYLSDGTLITETSSLVSALTTAKSTNTTVTTAVTNVTNAKNTVDSAVQSYNTAVQAYNTAAAAADSAAAEVLLKSDEAATEADKAIFDEVNAAQAVADAKDEAAGNAQDAVNAQQLVVNGASEALTNHQNNVLAPAQQAYDAAVSAKATELYNNARAPYQNAVNDARTAYDNAVSTWENASWRKKTYYWAVVLAKGAVLKEKKTELSLFESWNSVSDYNDDAKSALNGSEVATNLSNAKATEGTLQGTYNSELSTLSDLNATLTSALADQSAANAALAEAQDRQSELEQTILTAYNNANREQAKTDLINGMEALIDEYATDIDQAQYDQAINEWANTVFNDGWWRIFSKIKIRAEMDDFYDEEYESLWADLKDDLKDALNVLNITQWAISTSEVDTLIDNCINLSKAAIEDTYKKEAIVNATYAKLDAADTLQDAVDAKEIKLTTTDGETTASAVINGTIQSMTNAQSTFNNAVTTFNNAKSAYDQAVANAANLTVKSVTGLDALLAAVNAAQEALNNAYENLAVAQVAAEDAQNLADWAQAMITEQEMTVITDAEEMVVTVPYTIYRAYVESQTIAKIDETAEEGSAERFENVTDIYDQIGASTDLTKENRGIVYWALNEDGSLMLDVNGEAIIYYADANGNAPANMPNGKYFVGTVFAVTVSDVYDETNETDETRYWEEAPIYSRALMVVDLADVDLLDGGDISGYQMTGYSMNYVKPVTPNNDDRDDRSDRSEAGEVLGVSRIVDNTESSESEEGAVLGESRNPQTSDAANAGLWLSLMAASAACIAVLAKKKQSNEK